MHVATGVTAKHSLGAEFLKLGNCVSGYVKGEKAGIGDDELIEKEVKGIDSEGDGGGDGGVDGASKMRGLRAR